MFGLLKKNYALTLWLTRILLCLSIVAGQWFSIESSFAFLTQMGFDVPRVWYIFLIYGVVSTFIVEVVTRLLTKFIMFNLLKIYVVPYSEFVILLLVAKVVINFVCGIFKLIYLLTPVAMVFGEVLIGFVVSAAVYFCLFLVVKKLYLNDKNAPQIFKSCVSVFFVLTLIGIFVL